MIGPHNFALGKCLCSLEITSFMAIWLNLWMFRWSRQTWTSCRWGRCSNQASDYTLKARTFSPREGNPGNAGPGGCRDLGDGRFRSFGLGTCGEPRKKRNRGDPMFHTQGYKPQECFHGERFVGFARSPAFASSSQVWQGTLFFGFIRVAGLSPRCCG